MPAGGQKSGLERAKSKFTLVEPTAASDQLWNAYTAERRAIRKKFSTVGEEEEEEENDYDEFGDGAIAAAISKAVGDLEGELGLPKESLLSGISILEEDSSFEEENDPRTVTLLTRVYSVSSPSSVDLHLTYHSRSRSESIEWYIGIGYKINSRPSPNKLPDSSEVLRQIGLRGGSNFSFNMYGRNGWNTFYKAFFDDEQGFSGRRWKRCEEKEMGLYEAGLKDVHDALLGPHSCMDEETSQTSESDNEALKRQRLVQTARLLLACVGVTCSIATEDSERDELPGWRNGLNWLLEGIPSWFAREVREAAGFQLERDAKGAEKYAQAVKEEKQGHNYEDDSGSDDMYEDSDDGY